MRVVDIQGHEPHSSGKLSNDAVRQALLESGIEYLVTLPESRYEQLLRDLIQDDSINIVQVCRESEGMGICSGLAYGGKKAALLCSYKGLYNSIDSLLGTAMRTESSFLILLSEAAAQAQRAAHGPEGGCYSAELLNTLKIPYSEVREDQEVSLIREALEQTETNTQPVTVILRW